MAGSFEREIQNEIERLQSRIERLQGFLEEGEEYTPRSPDVRGRMAGVSEEGNGGTVSTAREKIEAARRSAGGAKSQPDASEMTDDEMLQLITEAPTNKNGSIDLRTDQGRTLRAVGLVDENGYPTEKAEALLGAGTGGRRSPARRGGGNRR